MAGQNATSKGNKVVISGIAGRFPNSSNITELQNNLLNKVDCTTTEHKRWAIDDPRIPNRLGVCNDIEKFDRIFFGIHTALTDIMDPVSRMLLEHSFEAIMDAGINPRSLRGEKIAVYSATNLSESEKRAYDPKAKKSGFGIMGGSKAMIANRISFFLGLTGPSINIDCDTTTSAVALERAYTGIKNGEFDGAIVAGGVMALHPHVSFQLRAIGRLSPDGVTRSFDDDADGHTRSDGIAVVFLQRAQDAKRIYMEVVNIRAEHTAPFCTTTMTDIIPTREPQIRLIEQVLRESGLSPDDISFLEASGMGYKDVDADELEAIAEVYKKRKNPLLVGAIQSNLGNTIPINSAAGIIKMIIASETGQIPPNLNYDTPNSRAKCLEDGRVEILTEMTPWTGEYSSVHTISITGTIANMILKTPNIEKKNEGIPDDDLPRLVVTSGRTEEAVDTLLSYMENTPVDAELLQMFYDIFESGIDGHLYRGYSIVPAKGLLPPDAKKRETFFNSGEKREVWWVFAGMGSQWVGMGEALLRLPVFEAAIRRCDAVLKPRGYDIFKIICDKDEKMFDNIVHSFIGIAAIQIALVDVLRSLGMKPDFIIGHSVGELGCAYADDCFSAEQMVLAALSRGLASKESDLIHGAMAAVGLGYEDVRPLCPPDIDVACHNGPDSSTISGPAESLRAFVASLTAKKIFAKEVASSNIAYHSRYIAPAGPKLLEYLQQVIPKPKPRSEKWLSTSVPRSEWNTLKARLCSAEYHTNNLLSSVLFEETSRMIPQNAICIEIAPHGLLQAILKKSLSPNCINVPLTKRGHPDNVEFMLTGLGKLYNIGLNPKISNLYPKVQYPVGRGTPSISSLVKWDHNADWYVTYFVPIERKVEGEITFEMNLHAANNEYLKGCRINGEINIPISLCLIKAWEILKTYEENPVDDVVFEDVQIHRLRVPVPNDNIVKLTIMVTKGNGKFGIVESDILVATGTVKSVEVANVARLDASKSSSNQAVKYEIEREDFYQEMEMRGFKYSGNFKNVLKSSLTGNNGLIQWDGNWATFIDNAIQLYSFGNDVRQVQVPLMIRKIIIDHQKQEEALENSGVPAFVDKNLNCITAGGLEIQGLKLVVLPRILEQNRLSSDALSVVPNIDKSSTSISESLRMVLQLVLENNFTSNKQVINFIEKTDSKASKAYKSLLYGVPEICLFKQESTTCDKATFNKALTILVEDLKEYDVNLIFQKLGSNKFLLTNIKNENEDSFIKLAESSNLKVIFIRKFINNNNLVLFRKKRSFANTQVINVNGNVKDTINKVRAIGVPSNDDRIIIVTKPKDNLNIVDLVNQLEQSTKLDKIRVFNIQDAIATDNLFTDQTYKKQLEADLLINILTPKKTWATVRRTTATHNLQPAKIWIANQTHSYDPANVNWTEGPSVEQAENIIKVEHSSLNSQDILLANGTFFSQTSEISGTKRIVPATFGFEYSGTDAKGSRVMGITCGNAMSTFVKSNPSWTWALPKSWSFEDGATVPLSYIIAYATLLVKAEIQEGETVLLHNVVDGPGLAMLNIAVHRKCDVYATYQTEQQRKLIKLTSNLPDSHLIDSTKESFTDDVVLKCGGVDVAICNQCGAKKAELLFSACRRKARVILVDDMNDNKFHENIGMEIFLREMNFFTVVPKQILTSDSSAKHVLAKMVLDGINTGCVKPLPRNAYDGKAINEAFHACIAKENLGKILVKVSAGKNENNQLTVLQRLYCSSSKTYVVIEGLNAFGLELIDWLVTRGAKRIVLISHSAIKDGYTNMRLSLWQKYGVQVVLRTNVDVSQSQNIKTLLKEASSLGPIDAIFDLQRMAPGKSSSFDSATKIVDQESRLLGSNLRLFAVFSAVANAGALPTEKKLSKTYSIDDAQERPVKELLEKRKKDGMHSVLIRWGLKGDSAVSKSITPSINKCIQKLDEVLTINETVVEVSYTVSLTDEVEKDTVEMQANQLDSEKIEKDAFIADLNTPVMENIFVLDI